MDLRVFLLLLLGTQFSLGIFIPSANRDFRKKAATIKTETKYSDLLRDLAVIKLRLETMGLGPVYIEGPYDNGRPMAKSLQDNDPVAQQPPIEDPASPFNEMEVLELVPVIIEQKRKGNVSPDEEKTLKEIFGDLWIVIEEEVNRVEGEEMNPILTALLQSHENRLKRALVQHHSRPQRQAWKRVEKKDDGDAGLEVVEQNDIFGNTVDRVRVTRFPKAFMEVNPAELSPQQRLMRHAALLIRQWFDENSPSRNARRGGLLRNRGPGKKRNINGIRGGQRRRPNNNRRSTNKRRGGGGGGSGNRRRNLRPKRHNTDIYVDDNHAPYDYEDFEDYFAIDDSMTKPRSMRSSARTFFNEYDSLEEEDDDDEVKMIDEEDY